MIWPLYVYKGLVFAAVFTSTFFGSSNAHDTVLSRQGRFGLVGYGISMYKPLCAFACQSVLAQSRLNCSTGDDDNSNFHTSPDCFASNDAYLQSLAWCISSRCIEENDWDIDKFWAVSAVGQSAHQLKPVYSYQKALSMVTTQPALIVAKNESLNQPAILSDDLWKEQYFSMSTMALVESRHSKYGIVLALTSILLPLFAACVGFVKSLSSFQRLTVSYITYPALFGKRHSTPLPFDIGLLPSRGQALFIGFMLLLNIILSAIGYHFPISGMSMTPNFNTRAEYFANRMGILSFANLTAIILYSSRNNPLIGLTGWSYSTFLLHHRWLAYICVLQAAIHSVVWIVLHIGFLSHKFSQAYWNVGALTTIIFVLILPSSILFVRRRYYELFLNLHIALALIGIAGCYYHIYLKFEHAWGYENWLYLAIVLWLLEKGVRGLKVLQNGLKTAIITSIDEEYFRVDIPGVSASGHAYLYFPTLSWRVWENHPFSIASPVYEGTEIDSEQSHSGDAVFELVGSDEESDGDSDVGENHTLKDLDPYRNVDRPVPIIPETPLMSETPRPEIGLLSSPCDESEEKHSLHDDDDRHSPEYFATGPTFYIRRQKGITSRLCMHERARLPVLVETPYRSLSLDHFATLAHLVCIIGGVGISTVLPVLRARASASTGRTALYWSCRSPALVREVGVQRLSASGFDVHLRVGERWDVKDSVMRETRRGVRGGDVVVVVSGPASMADAVRHAVVSANRERRKNGRDGMVTLVEECFSW